MKLLKSLKTMGAATLFGVSALLAAPAVAQAPSLNDVINAIKRDSDALTADNEKRLADFRAATAEQSRLLASARTELNGIQARAQALSAEFDANERRLGELQDQLSAEAGDFSDLLGQFRTAVGETTPIIARSVSNFEYTGRVEGLAQVAEARTLPTRQELDRLPKAILQEMVAQSEVKSFTAEVANSGDNGENVQKEVFRVGVFTIATVDGTRFIQVAEKQSGETFLQEFSTQPRGAFQGAMADLIRAGDGEVVRAPFDPTRGQLFDIFKDMPDFGDRIAAGGEIGYVILALAVIGILIGLYKIVTLTMLGGAMRSTAKSLQPGTGNPLARVLEVYEANKGEDVETLELKLDEQILKETPKIERFNDIIKVLAAIAPLLGLLGTVIGMIITFTQITLFGAGDPKIMAGGISVALMTTVFGLVAAIPLILIHAFASGASRNAQQILDEQAAGLVAKRAEQLGRAAA